MQHPSYFYGMEDLLLLHGAIGSKEQLAPLAALLGDSYSIHNISFIGHGGDRFAEDELSLELFAKQVQEYLSEKDIESVNVFGYSMGGYVAMILAKKDPRKIKKIITLATKFHWDETVAANEIKFLDPEKIEQKIPAFAQQLKARHHPNDWKLLLEKTTNMLLAMGQKNPLQLQDYTDIQTPSLLLLGDRDKMITLDETLAVYRQLPNAQFGMLPATGHPIEQVDVELLAFFIKRFLST